MEGRHGGLKIHTPWVAREKSYVVRWQLPGERGWHQRKAYTRRKRDAERLANEIEQEVLAELSGSKVSWRTVRSRYRLEVLGEQRASSIKKWTVAMNALSTFGEPQFLEGMTADRLSRLGAQLRSKALAVDTIAGYVREIRRTLTWAASIWPSFTSPTIRKMRTKTGKRMKGRPITREEFERMLGAVETVVPSEYVLGWRHYLEGLWYSGLRLGESLRLAWEDRGELSIEDLDSSDPRLLVRGEAEKGDRDRWIRLWPHPSDGTPPPNSGFIAFLQETPLFQRRGLVFRPELSQGRVAASTAGKTVAAIGEAAGVVVDRRRKPNPETGELQESVSFASAQDLRRSFGTRWALCVSIWRLMEMMRHETIRTTEQFYVDLQAVAKPRQSKHHTPEWAEE